MDCNNCTEPVEFDGTDRPHGYCSIDCKELVQGDLEAGLELFGSYELQLAEAMEYAWAE